MKKFDHYCSNLEVLSQADRQDLENPFIIGGIIDIFFIQLELGWKTLKDIMAYEGLDVARTGSPREIIKAAWTMFDSMDEDTRLSMLSQRNNMAHVYDAAAARALVARIIDTYTPAFRALKREILERWGESLHSI